MENRREFIKKAGLLSAALGASGLIPPAIQKAMAINPAPGSSYLDAEHIVLLMQENRSFDHTFGTLRGVRGFQDPRAIRLSNDYPVWLQRNKKGQTYAPFRLNLNDTNATWMNSLPHSWNNQVDARNKGRYDGWLDAKRSGNEAYADMPLTMGYYNREDIPFYYALADAFTVCDHSFCSSLTGTSPNRSFFWTGKIKQKQDEDSVAHVSNDQIDIPEHNTWKTFPERLSAAGIDWKIYQNEISIGAGLSDEEEEWLANFTDNSLEFFKQYKVTCHPEYLKSLGLKIRKMEVKPAGERTEKDLENLKHWKEAFKMASENPLEAQDAKTQDLHRRAFVTNRNDPDYHTLETISYKADGKQVSAQIPKGDVLHQFRKDTDSGKLPAVSWLVAPCNFSDHPSAPWYGAWYVSEVLDILTKNPEVWKKTVFILTYDENDGYFDHLPPVVAPNPKDPETGLVSPELDIRAEYVYAGQSSRESPVGLGFRVPTVIVSPWSRGGYVNSQVYDHTSSLQFLEKFLSHKTGKTIKEENITSWRRSLCGDYSSVFRPYNGEKISFPEPVARVPYLEHIHSAQFKPLPKEYHNLNRQEIAQILKDPQKSPFMPIQESGIRPANALPYELYANASLNKERKEIGIRFKSGNEFFAGASSGAGFTVYGHHRTWSFTAAAGDSLEYKWPLSLFPEQHYQLEVNGVNGFYRAYQGTAQDPDVTVQLEYTLDNSGRPDGNIRLLIKRQKGNVPLHFKLEHQAYYTKIAELRLNAGEKEKALVFDLKGSHSWYDFKLSELAHPAFRQHYAGHVENGKQSSSDPQIGAA